MRVLARLVRVVEVPELARVPQFRVRREHERRQRLVLMAAVILHLAGAFLGDGLAAVVGSFGYHALTFPTRD